MKLKAIFTLYKNVVANLGYDIEDAIPPRDHLDASKGCVLNLSHITAHSFGPAVVRENEKAIQNRLL